MSSTQPAHVVIIGAGPSGSLAAALLNKQGINATIIEKSTFPRFSIGESLLPACMESLKKADMFDTVNAAGFQFKNGAAFHANGKYTEFDFTDKYTAGEGTTFQVQRGHFDKLLADCAEQQGVTINYEHEVKSIDVERDKPLLMVLDENQHSYEIEADFILDASGFGRVLPRLLGLEEPSTLPPRRAIFTHIEDNITAAHYDRNKILVSVHPDDSKVWYWLIPFSNGTCSFGVVAEPEFFANYPDDHLEALKQLAREEHNLAALLAQANYPNPCGSIMGYSANVTKLFDRNFALLGNAGEFLDPVFSSGVTIAMKSAELATDLLIKQFNNETVDWQTDYADTLMTGVNAFRCYVEGWYTGEFQDVVLHDNPNPKIKQMICSILAGYAWDETNPFVAEPARRLKIVAALCKS
ncbi:NAD(P)/FAD-dependent oxidoreductase [Moritella yayanosii]|uniref:FAD-dependent oxidoreductase n=1 Tax=Moritella yayanosii TaxID=69539 RepID=A0A330LJX7_9GAMM|nr:NAD(P)/FAD-dependent oxidoreductase [Moritella yayanosii]SQD77407.1 FAD-dependent oxidoreductase [Moritella yayanosii]